MMSEIIELKNFLLKLSIETCNGTEAMMHLRERLELVQNVNAK